MDEIFKDGKKRYEDKIPPGYLDTEKGDFDQFGDLIFWNQIIDNAITTNRPVILITSDLKEDWWFIHSGSKLGPRMELIAEMKEKANVSYFQYTPANFANYAKKYLSSPISKDAIEEAQDIQNAVHISFKHNKNLDFPSSWIDDASVKKIQYSLYHPDISNTQDLHNYYAYPTSDLNNYQRIAWEPTKIIGPISNVKMEISPKDYLKYLIKN